MRESEYSVAAVEVLDILNYTNQEDVRKIPQSFIKFLIDISSKNYKSEFNHEYPISGLNLRKGTKELLGFIYITWWCDEKDRIKYKNMIHSNNSKTGILTNYNVENIFKNKIERRANENIENNNIKETLMVECREENVFKKFINKLLSSFINKNERR